MSVIVLCVRKKSECINKLHTNVCNVLCNAEITIIRNVISHESLQTQKINFRNNKTPFYGKVRIY